MGKGKRSKHYELVSAEPVIAPLTASTTLDSPGKQYVQHFNPQDVIYAEYRTGPHAYDVRD